MAPKLLIVDNDPLFLKFMVKKFTDAGYEIKAAEDGISALELLTTYPPDIIFVDLIMPNIDGKKLCRIIRHMPPFNQCRLVLISAAAIELESDLVAIDADGFIAKGSFGTTVQHMLNHIHKIDRPFSKSDPQTVHGIDSVYARQMTKELLRRNQHLEDFLSGISEGIIEIVRGHIVYANQSASDLLGVSLEKLLMQRFIDAFNPGTQQQITRFITPQKNGTTESARQLTIPLGKKYLSLRKLKNNALSKKTILLLTDITEQKKTEDQLHQAQKMQVIGTLASGIAHDFNNILTIIVGNAEMALLKGAAESHIQKHLTKINEASQRARDLIVQILNFSRHSMPKRRPINFSDTIKDALGMISSTLPSTTEIISDIPPLPDDILADAVQIHQVLINLCINAVHAMNSKGTLEIKVQKILITNAQKNAPPDIPPGDYMRLSVKDTGTGISKEQMSHIFDPYFSTKAPEKGAGLGLTVVFGIVKNHDGAIQVKSEFGKGANFHIYFPITSLQSCPEKKAPSAMRQGNETVLFVDDEKILIQVASQMLTFLGYKAVCFHDPLDALTLFKAKPHKFDLVITDLTMPHISGDELAEELLKIRPDIPIILCTGHHSQKDGGKIFHAGIRRLLQKPLTFKDLSDTIREVID